MKNGAFMKKKYLMLGLKILAIILWIVVLFLPDMCAGIQNVKSLSITQTGIGKIENGVYRKFEVEFTKKVVKGTIIVQFVDANDELVIEQVVEISNNDSYIAKFNMPDSKFDKITSYRVKSSHMQTPLVYVLKKVCAVASVVLLVFVLMIIRMDYEEYQIDNQKFVVYSGIVRHFVKLNNEIIMNKNHIILTKKDVFEYEIAKDKTLQITFFATNNVGIELIDKTNLSENAE